ncbi:relaxase/mobilization nuclease domain-containing protein [Rhizomonospora bruguierae]|uniref:relaxase/mobilization nuclease domain-containing protein n=1 Tax=Rhizomonospora bruguierae TaxID=1581705 RepID=UPI001BD08E7A|nr:hypothetical protein [Micromonospora sp. NBRC 107566]
MIPRVRPRSASAREVLRYLFGPGENGEHHDPRLVAGWETAAIGEVAELQPPRTGGGFSLAGLAGLLEQPVLAGNNPPDRPVWHCSVHNHGDDPLSPDERWAQIAVAFVEGVGLAPAGDRASVRWVAVRHGDDHVHLVATLVRQDGPTVWPRNDYRRCQSVARELEGLLGLRPGGPRSAEEAGGDG